MVNRTALKAALISAILASAGGIAFLKIHSNPTLNEIQAACAKGEVSGAVCIQDINGEIDISNPGERRQ